MTKQISSHYIGFAVLNRLNRFVCSSVPYNAKAFIVDMKYYCVQYLTAIAYICL